VVLSACDTAGDDPLEGVRNLRIADSSVMPRIPRVATMAPCVFIGERMAEILSTKA
jgi:choline dehydrogenase